MSRDAAPRTRPSEVDSTSSSPPDARQSDTGFSRRGLLASAATAGTALLAGCSSDGATLEYDVEHDDPGETFLRFSSGGSHVGTAGYMLSAPTSRPARLRFHVFTQVNGVSSVRLRFKPLLPPGVHHRVLLERPGGSPYPDFSFEVGEGHGWTLFEVPDLGAQTPGSYSVDFYIDVFEEEPKPFDLATELSITFDNGWDPRTLRGEANVTARGPSDD